MNKFLFLTLLFLAFFTKASAQVSQIGHDLTVFSEDGLKFTLTINGMVVNEEPSSQVVVKDLHNDYVKAILTFQDPSIPVIKRNILQLRSGGNSSGYPEAVVYEVKKKKEEYVLRWSSASAKKIQQSPSQVIIIQEQAAPANNSVQIKTPNVTITVPQASPPAK